MIEESTMLVVEDQQRRRPPQRVVAADGVEAEVPLLLAQELEEHLLSIARDQHGGFLCPTLARIRIDGRRGLSAQFMELMKQAGLSREQVQSNKNKFSRKSFHSLRHSFASALANSVLVRRNSTRRESVEHLCEPPRGHSFITPLSN